LWIVLFYSIRPTTTKHSCMSIAETELQQMKSNVSQAKVHTQRSCLKG
jgi:hypothetical protein